MVVEWNCKRMRVVELWSNRSRITVERQLSHLLVSVDEVDIWVESTTSRNVMARVQIRGAPVHCLQSNGVIIHMTSRTLHSPATSWITYYSTFPAESKGAGLVGGSGGRSPPQLKVATSKLYAFLVVIHTIYEVETLIIENENYEAQLQSTNSAPIRTTFIQRMKKNVEVSGVLHFALDYVSYTIRNIYNLPFNESSVLPSWLEGVGCIYLSTAASPSNTCWFITSSSMTSRDCSGSMTLLHCALLRREWGVTDYIVAFIPARDDDIMYFSNLNERLLLLGSGPKRVKQRAP